jgi:ribosomal protein L7/L12
VSALLFVVVVDLAFVGASVYLIAEDHLLPGLVMMLMSMVATGLLVVRLVARAPVARERRTGAPLFTPSRLQPEVVALEPELEDTIAALARENKIAAVKRVIELTGASLRTAKDYVEGLSRGR